MSKFKLNEFQPECSEDPKTGIKQIKINSRIEILKNRFYFHDILKSSSGFSNHFIIEDLEVDPEEQEDDPDAQLFYYLKQTVYRNKAEFQYALSFYKKMYQYCQAKFAKSDIIRLHYIYNHEVDAEKYYELAVIFDFGEPDRIDIDHIEPQHINKFLKNICILLNDIKKFDKLYHSNIAVHNIVLVNNELKLSGFKPRYLEQTTNNSWKIELAKKSNHFRLDLFLIGLIWLRFLGLKQVDEIMESHSNLAHIKSMVEKVVNQANAQQRKEIVLKLINYEDYPNVDLDEVILDFDEYYILENIKSLEKQRQSESSKNQFLVSTSQQKDDQPMEFYFDSKDHQNYPSEHFESDHGRIQRSDSKDTNLFLRPYRESVPNLLRNVGDDFNFQKDKEREKEEFLRIDDDFTLKDNNSVDHYAPHHDRDPVLNDDLIDIQDQRANIPQRSPSADVKRESQEKTPENSMRLRINSEKKLNLRTSDRQIVEGMRKLRSQENLNQAKKKIIEEDEEYVENDGAIPDHDQVDDFEKEFDDIIEREIEKPIQNKTKPDGKGEPMDINRIMSKGAFKKESTKSLKKLEEKFKYVDEDADPNDLLLKALREKKHQLEEPKAHNIELTDDQKQKIHKEVEEDLEKLLENQLVKIKKGKEDILIKELERKEQEKILKEKIEKKLAENLEKKKKDKEREKETKDKGKKPSLSPNPKQESDGQRSLKILKADKESGLGSKAKIEGISKSSSNSKLAKKPVEKDAIEEMNKKFSKQFDLSTADQRRQMFDADGFVQETEVKSGIFKNNSKSSDSLTNPVEEIKHVIKSPVNYSECLHEVQSGQFNTFSKDAESNQINYDTINARTDGSETLEGLKNNAVYNINASQDLEKLKQQLKDSIKKDVQRVPESQPEAHVELPHQPAQRIFDQFPSLDYSSQYSTPGQSNKHEVDDQAPSFTANHHTGTLHSLGKPDITFGNIQSQFDSQYNTANNHTDPYDPQETFDYKITVTKRLFVQKRYREALEYLEAIRHKFPISQDIEILKLLSLVHFKMNDLETAKSTLIEAIQLLRENLGLENAVDLIKSILINIAIIDFHSKNYEEVIVILRNKSFEEPDAISIGYYQLLGDAYYALEDYHEAFICYDSELKLVIAKEVDENTLNDILSVSSKIVMALVQINEPEILYKFFENMRAILTKAEEHEAELKGPRPLENASWRFVYRLAKLLQDMGFTENLHGLLKEFTQIDIEENGCALEEQEKEELLNILVRIILWLKNVPDQSLRKTSILGLIVWGLDLVQTMDATDDTNRHYLFLLFNKGMFLFEEDEYTMAKESFDLCLEVHYLSEDAPMSDLLLILFNIGVCLQRLENYDEASFYFEKVIQEEKNDSAVKIKTIKILSQIYYKLEIFNKCHDVLYQWVMQNYQKTAKDSFFKYIYMLYNSCRIIGSDHTQAVTDAMRWFVSRHESNQSSYFIHAYFNLTEEALDQGNFQQSEQYLKVVKELFKKDSNNAFQKEFVGDVNIMYANFGQQKYQEALNLNKSLQKVMHDNPSEFEGSENTIMNFLVNFMFVILSKLSVDEENLALIKERQQTMESILKFKEERQIKDKVYELIKLQQDLMVSFVSQTEIMQTPLEDVQMYESKTINSAKNVPEQVPKFSRKLYQSNASTEVRKSPVFNSKRQNDLSSGQKADLPALQPSLRISEEPELESQKDVSSNAPKRIRRINSDEILKKSNLKKKTKCSCFEFSRKNSELCKLVEQFIDSLKQVALPMAINYVESSFTKLEDGVKEKLLHFERFIYIKRMVKFFLAKQKQKPSEKSKYFEFFDSVIDSKDLCIHDLKHMVFLFEIFSEGDSNYLIYFLQFLDQEHKNLAKLVFSQLFLEGYNRRFEKLMANVYKRINGNRFASLENFSLMHCLEFKPIVPLIPNDRASCFKHLIKPRYSLMKDPANYSMLLKYLNPLDIIHFYMRKEIQTALVNMVRKEAANSVTVIKDLFEAFGRLFANTKFDKITQKSLMYELFPVIYFLDFSEADKVTEAVLQLLYMIEAKVSENVLYHFSIAASFIGNILFKYKLFEASIKTKLLAFETMKRIREVEMVFPVYVKEVDPKAHMFSILSFMMVNQIELEKLEPAKAFLDKLNSISFDTAINNLEKKILTAFFEFVTDNVKNAKSSIESAQKSFEKITWTENQKDVFKAIIDKIILNIAKRTSRIDQITQELSAYEASIAKLYKL